MNENFEKLMEEQRQLMESRLKFLKTGDNAINLIFHGELNDIELGNIEKILENENLEFGYFNDSGFIKNSLDEFTLDTFFQISYPIVVVLTQNITGSALWEVIKESIIFAFKKIKVKKLTRIQGDKIEQKNIKFGVKLRVDKTTELEFELNGNLNDEMINNSLDKILDVIKNNKSNDGFRLPKYYEFENDWEMKDFQKYLESKRNKKKDSR